MDNKKNPWPMLYVFFICLSLNNHLSLGADTISVNQSLSGDQTIVSKGGNFELGFFKPGNSSLSKYYIGMWYKKVSLRTIVWVANRDKPVSDKSSSVLRISEDGNLVLLNEAQLPVWSTNLSFTSSGPVQAVLQDDGNLVLKDGSNSSKPFWQSFDNPAHTLLPGAKIAYNNKTKQSQRLISWRNSEDPAAGLFSLELDVTSSSYIILWNNSERYGTSGSWNGQIFSLIPEMRYSYSYFSYVTNENESYFTYSLYDPSTISRITLGVSGLIQQLTWWEAIKRWNLLWAQPESQCEVYAYCGTYGRCSEQSLPPCKCLKGFQPTSDNNWNLFDYSGGCKRKTSLQCGNASLANGKRDKFLEMPNVKVPLQAQSVAVGSSSECESTCLNNCACTAYAYDKGCSIWIGDLLNLRQLTIDDSSGGTLYLKLAASELPSSRITEPSKKERKKSTWIAPVIPTVSLVLFLGTFCCIWRIFQGRGAIKRKEEKHLLELTTPDRLLDADELGNYRNTGHNINVFSFASIATATNNFSPESKLGEGGFGPVYKGRLPEGREIAVKRLSRNSGQGLVEFKNELILITKLQHMNLVRLLGCCFQGEEKMLIYEYMPNKSLDSFLFDPSKNDLLDWKKRVNIIEGIAQGLLYLHRYSRVKVIHRDLKASNILLDENMCAKISDFGMARIFNRDGVQANTKRIVGTYGYMSPEYAMEGIFSEKSDVFSFGVLILEIVSGRRNNSFCHVNGPLNLVGYAWELWQRGVGLDLMDPILKDSCPTHQLLRFIHVGLSCVEDCATDRPTIPEVITMLKNETVPLPMHKKPAFYTGNSVIDEVLQKKGSENLSVNGLSISMMEAR